MAAGEGEKLEYTPTWIVTVVCSVFVIISLFVERLLHYLGKLLKRKNQRPLYEALLKVKEELMLLGFISLLLVVFQGPLERTCIPESYTRDMLPCKRPETGSVIATAHYSSGFFAGVLGGGRRLLASGGEGSDYCAKKGKVPLLSFEAIHQLHIFIFVLAITHVLLSVATMLLGSLKIRQWKHWEDSIQKNVAGIDPNKVTCVNQFQFIRDRFKGIGKDSMILSWVHSFFKQFYGSVTESDYTTMRLGFIMTHCRGNPKFDFHKYMVRALEDDFEKVVGISWYLWIFVMVFLLLNVHGWHTYFLISFIPAVLLLAVGTKMEHVITQLAHDVAEKKSAIEGDLVVKPSDDHFWFHRPRIILYLIHFILFQSAFEIAFFFWILTTYGLDSCIMDRVGYLIPRLVISVLVQLLCSYSTLPLYAIVTQMGSSFMKAILNEPLRAGLVRWHKEVKKRRKQRVHNIEESVSNHEEPRNGSSTGIQLQVIVHEDSRMAGEGGRGVTLAQLLHDP